MKSPAELENLARAWGQRHNLAMRLGVVGEWVFYRGDLWMIVVSDELSDLSWADAQTALEKRLQQVESSGTTGPPPTEV